MGRLRESTRSNTIQRIRHDDANAEDESFADAALSCDGPRASDTEKE